MFVVNCYVCGELLLLTRSKARPAASKRKDDGQLDAEGQFSDCLSFRQRVVAKKAFEMNKRNNLSFSVDFSTQLFGISLAQSVQPEAKKLVCRRCSHETRGNESSTKFNFSRGGIEE